MGLRDWLVELASLLARAERDGRIHEAGVAERLGAYGNGTADDGPIGVAPLGTDTLVRARMFVLQAPVRTLDAIHLGLRRNSWPTPAMTRLSSSPATLVKPAATDLGFTLYDAS